MCFSNLVQGSLSLKTLAVPAVSIPSVMDFGTRLAAVVLFQQQHHHLPRRRSEDRDEQSLANWLDKAHQRKDRSLGSMPSKRQLTPTEAAQLTELLNAPQSSDAAPKDGMDVVENDEQDAGVESDHENENAMVHHSARSNPQPKAKRKQMEDDSTESSQKAHRKAEEDEDETCTHTHRHAHTDMHTDTHRHTQTHTHTDTHRHTQTHTALHCVPLDIS